MPSEVAFRYGFADLSHFNRRFKRIYGRTPYQYRPQGSAHTLAVALLNKYYCLPLPLSELRFLGITGRAPWSSICSRMRSLSYPLSATIASPEGSWAIRPGASVLSLMLPPVSLKATGNP